MKHFVLVMQNIDTRCPYSSYKYIKFDMCLNFTDELFTFRPHLCCYYHNVSVVVSSGFFRFLLISGKLEADLY